MKSSRQIDVLGDTICMQLISRIRDIFATSSSSPARDQEGPHEAQAASVIEDHFEAPELLSIRNAEILLPKAVELLDSLKALIQKTSRIVAPNRTLELMLKTREFQKNLDGMLEAFEEGQAPAQAQMVQLRREMWEAQVQVAHIQKHHLAESLRMCPREARAKIEALTIMQAIQDGDKEFVVARLPRFRNIQPPKVDEAKILHRFDSHLLQMFARQGLVESMSVDEHDELERQLEELPDLERHFQRASKECSDLEKQIQENTGTGEERSALLTLLTVKKSACNQIDLRIEDLQAQKIKLNRQYYLRDNYYLAKLNCLPLLERLALMLDNASVAIASRQRLGKQIIETLYRGHFEIFCAFGIIEQLQPSQLNSMTAQGFCDPNEFIRKGKDYYRISNSGIYALKQALSLTEAFVPKAPLVKPKPKSTLAEITSKSEPRAEVESEAPFPRYAIIPLEEAVEFY